MQLHVLAGGTEIVVVIQKCNYVLLSLSALDVVTLYPSFSLELLFYTYIYIYIDSTYTVEEAVEKLGFGSFQLLVTVFSGLLWVSREVPLQ